QKVNSVGRGEMKMPITDAPVETGRSLKSFSESASERLQRTVVGVQGDIRDRHIGVPELICRPLQQKPPAHGGRSFVHDSAERPVKLRAALVRLPRQILCF